MRLRHSVAAVLALLAFAASNASAALHGYSCVINAAQEVPTNTSPGTGVGTFVHDDVAHTLTFAISFQGLVSSFNNGTGIVPSGLTASHIHGPAAAGVNAGVLFFLPFNPLLGLQAGSMNGVWNMTATNETQLAASQLYVNIHSNFRPGGEIRGQIVPDQAVPTHGTSWGRIKSLYR